jgi:bacteriorhodopsin
MRAEWNCITAARVTSLQAMTLLFVFAVVIIVALVGSLPIWPHSKNWGYYPVGVSLILVILLALYFTGHLHAH